MSKIYEESKDEDGFLYVTYSGENTCDRFPRSVSDDHVLVFKLHAASRTQLCRGPCASFDPAPPGVAGSLGE